MTRFPMMRSNAFERRMLFDRASQRHAASRPVVVPAFERPSIVAQS